MKRFNFKTTLSIILITTQISCAQRKAKYYTVSGIVTTTSSYCGGAVPSQEMLAEMNKPKPVVKQLFIFTGEKISDSSLLLTYFTTDSAGHFQIKLKKGTYCIVEVQKSKALKIPKDDENSKWDVDCLKEQHTQCDYQLNVNDKNVDDVKINFPIPCIWSKPCLQYSGPLPPSAPPGR